MDKFFHFPIEKTSEGAIEFPAKISDSPILVDEGQFVKTGSQTDTEFDIIYTRLPLPYFIYLMLINYRKEEKQEF